MFDNMLVYSLFGLSEQPVTYSFDGIGHTPALKVFRSAEMFVIGED